MLFFRSSSVLFSPSVSFPSCCVCCVSCRLSPWPAPFTAHGEQKQLKWTFFVHSLSPTELASFRDKLFINNRETRWKKSNDQRVAAEDSQCGLGHNNSLCEWKTFSQYFHSKKMNALSIRNLDICRSPPLTWLQTKLPNRRRQVDGEREKVQKNMPHYYYRAKREKGKRKFS